MSARPCPFCGQVGGVVRRWEADPVSPALACVANGRAVVLAQAECTGCGAGGPLGFGIVEGAGAEARDDAGLRAHAMAEARWQARRTPAEGAPA